MSVSGIIGAIIMGLVVGALGRLFAPGKQNISLLVTMLLGVLSSFIAFFLLGMLFHYNNDNGGIPWIGILGGGVVAAALIALYGRLKK